MGRTTGAFGEGVFFLPNGLFGLFVRCGPMFDHWDLEKKLDFCLNGGSEGLYMRFTHPYEAEVAVVLFFFFFLPFTFAYYLIVL
ncbi:hypothetical protein M441DRAFT_252935 [Trichoderma asperellum CBS 433.97]|uniref:Uncharacterized protein n=1 Tax=Trichoderma asperellum (strain ATCC 204424 / CBS 433.97 / NBRC 101777) TaxID=1042311 RepID=A0A2T3YY94_TRIA4|nr:hypothetical protein M441DRAFT_252935 [Trichoderma asperellum CBS 433.97]PTB37500.1 hypothetical protein M441DRAFT_252935 [Trichoderma asperellum CBS 433.97]